MPSTRSGICTSSNARDLKDRLVTEQHALRIKQHMLEMFQKRGVSGDEDMAKELEMRIEITDKEADLERLKLTIGDLEMATAAAAPPAAHPNAPSVSAPAASTAMQEQIQRLLTRQILEGKLSKFDGDPVRWRKFKASYDRTSAQMQLSDEENLGRLNEALHGAAHQHVRHMLQDPGRLREILETLERRFGNEVITLQGAIDKLDRAARPDLRKPQSIIDFAEAVGDLYATVAGRAGGETHVLLQIERKLSPELLSHWGSFWRERDRPYCVDSLNRWVGQLADDAWKAIALGGPAAKGTDDSAVKRFSEPRGRVHSVSAPPKPRMCFACKQQGHFVMNCDQFKARTAEARLATVRQNNMCTNCLIVGHKAEACRSPRRCAMVGCGAKHHSLLHAANLDAVNVVNAGGLRGYAPVLPVRVSGPYGTVEIFAFIDTGANMSFIDRDVAATVGAAGPPTEIRLDGYFSKENFLEASVVDLTVTAVTGGPRCDLKGVLSADVPLGCTTIDGDEIKRRFPYAANVPLAKFSATPKLLIGSPHTHATETLEVVSRHPGEPRFYRTQLGWYVMGPKEMRDPTATAYFVSEAVLETDFEETVKHALLIDDIGVRERPRLQAIEDERALDIMRRTTRRTGPNSIEIGLLWRSDDVQLPDNYRSALMRLECLERKMARSAEYTTAVRAKIADLQQKRYIVKTNHVYGERTTPRDWYIPIFGVYNKNKPGKVRLVADCAAKTDGVSLNQLMLPGPDLNQSIVGVLLRFRRHKHAVVGDVEEMFHRVFVRPEDRCAQRILWRNGDSSKAPDIYEYQVMTFGATCSPACAQFVKNWNAASYTESHPRAARAIKRQFYVDDYLDSFTTINEAVQTVTDVFDIQLKAGYKTRGWLSNTAAVLGAIDNTLLSPHAEKLLSGGEERVLGLKWIPSRDALHIATNQDVLARCGDQLPTKRQALAAVMSVYDPLGLVAFVVARGKIMLQNVWRTQIGWDERLPSSLGEQWAHFVDAVQLISTAEIPRTYCRGDLLAGECELHVFCDASESAYAASVYLRASIGESVQTSIVFGKSRVAPVKTLTIPRLELQAALLGARIADLVTEELELKVRRRVFWTDSRTALSWITSDTRRYGMFVSNRVAEILERTQVDDWRWVPTLQNPADLGTRNTSLQDFPDLWFKGPEFLQRPEAEWPTTDRNFTTSEEARATIHAVVATEQAWKPRPDAARFSKLKVLLRVTACYLRPIGIGGTFTPAEMESALQHHVQQAQQSSFAAEINRLQQGRAAKGKLKGYEVQLVDGFLRLKTRLEHAVYLPHDTRNPFVLHGDNAFARLLIFTEHQRQGHQGRETVKSELRRRYCIIGLTAVLKAISRECCFCALRRSQPNTPPMADLPQFRVEPGKQPFQHCGLDFFGPFLVKIGRRREKRWGAIFTCLATRAVHLEIAASLSADSALQAISRMCCRRGPPEAIYCDNGTNFHGAETELQLLRNRSVRAAGERGIRFVYMPPHAPHMGGAWERLVRSVKSVLTGLLFDRVLSDETAYTLFTEAEWILNCRPLTPVTSEPQDEPPITPNHFLLAWRSGQKGDILHPREVYASHDADLYGNRQWRASQRLADLFWKRWVQEYLPFICRRTKWTRDAEAICIGDIVLIVDPLAPRNIWRKGIVTRTLPGRDGVTRVVDVKTENGRLLRRPVTKLCIITKRAGGMQHPGE